MAWGARNLISTQDRTLLLASTVLAFDGEARPPRAAVVVLRTLAPRALAGRLVALVLIIIGTLFFASPLPILRREALAPGTALVVVVAVLARALALLLVALVGLVVGAFVETFPLRRPLLHRWGRLVS